MNRIAFLFLLFLCTNLVQAFSLVNVQAEKRSPTDEAKEIIADIISVTGLKQNFELKPANISNAAAVAYNGKRYILYNPAFISKLNTAAGNKWASVSVLAHEIGHHLNGHTLKNVGSQPPLELEADEFSGFILRKMGASLSQSQAAMKLAASYKPSHTNPGQRDRLIAIETGWNKAGNEEDMAKYSKPVHPHEKQPGSQVPAVKKGNYDNTVLQSRYILGTVDFPSDRTGKYFVTTRYNVVKVANGQLYLVGKMRATDSKNYPFILTGSNNILYVDRTGKIFTASRQVAGFIRI